MNFQIPNAMTQEMKEGLRNLLEESENPEIRDSMVTVL